MTVTTKKVKQITMREHIKSRSMWAGSKSNQFLEMHIIDGEQFELKEIEYPPALYKIVDEIIVNAIDHHSNYPKDVKNIKIELSNDGVISVENDGPGIHIEKVKNANGVEMYSPQLIFCEFLSGSNLDDKDVTERIVGGQNGLGSKITSVLSDYFTVETLDTVSKKKYIQTNRDGLSVIEPPKITSTKNKKSYTKITFLPSYKSEFGIDIEKYIDTLQALIKTRSYQAAAYSEINVYFNKVKLPVKNFKSYCNLFNTDVYHFRLDHKKFPWEVCVGLSNGKEQNISIVNGIFINSGGTHINYLQRQIVNGLLPYIEKDLKKAKIEFKKNIFTNALFIFMKGAIPNVEFKSQTKDSISNDSRKYKYTIDDKDCKKLWEFVKPHVMDLFMSRQLGKSSKKANRSKLDVPKYKEAKLVRDPKKWHLTGLIVTEGDSANGTAEKGLLSKASPTFNYDYFGTFTIQGVPMNGLKESTEYKKPKSEKISINIDDNDDIIGNKNTLNKLIEKKYPYLRLPSQKLKDNERLSSLMKILGLDYNKTYDFSPEGEKEWNTLRYGYIAALMDQDLDGFNIFGLLVVFIMTYWPHLITRGFIKRINTPLIRAYPKNKKKFTVKEFYTEDEASKWTTSLGENFVKTNYNIQYYKGLGSHDAGIGEVKQLFKNINDKITTYALDKNSIDNMIIYYGKETKKRKEVLSSKVSEISKVSNVVALSKQFKIDTKLYQRDNILRKLCNSVDGFIQGRRKIFYAMTKLGHKRIKVQGAAGNAVSIANYHHGESSAEGSIIRMSQAFPQARNLPLLLPSGQFGNRSKGYKDSASSRYVYTKLNYKITDKLFRKEDEYILQYTLEDGNRYEPDHYVPIIPYALCESETMPATGWKICTHARDINDIIKNLKRKIKGEIKKCGKLKMNTTNFNGRFVKHKGKTYFVGKYVFDKKKNIVTITGLPIDTWSYYYLEGSKADNIKKKNDKNKNNKVERKTKEGGIKEKEYVKDYEDLTTDYGGVKIIIYLKKDAYKHISKNYGDEVFDCFEDYFELKCSINDQLNLVNGKNEVVEYKSYEEIFDYWYEYRKNLYEIRIKREFLINSLMLKMLLEIQKFSKTHDKYNITNKTSEDKLNKILEDNKYLKFNKTILMNPKFEDIEILENLIMSPDCGATYDYLINLTYRDLTKNAYNKRNEQIEKLKNRQELLSDNSGKFPGANIWLREIEELELAINEGVKTRWQYNDGGYKFEE